MAATNAWNKPLYRPRYPKISLDSYTREDDVTFSFGRVTSYSEVLNLLSRSGCFKPEDYLNAIKMMRITKSLDNGQVFVTTAEKGLTDLWAEKLNTFAGKDIKKCHTYTDKEVLVHFSFIHPSVNVETEIVDGFLRKFHGRVKDFFPQKDKFWKIPNGSWTFVMFEEDLRANPIPECIYLDHVQVWISYRTQVNLCHNCGKDGHFANNCPNRVAFPVLGGTQDASSSVFLDGVIPKASRLNLRSKSDDTLKGKSDIRPNGIPDSQSGENGDKMTSLSKEAQKSFDNGAKAALSSKLADKSLPVNNGGNGPGDNENGGNAGVKRGRDDGEDEASQAKVLATDEQSDSEKDSTIGKGEESDMEDDQENKSFWDVSDELRASGSDISVANSEVVVTSPSVAKPG